MERSRNAPSSSFSPMRAAFWGISPLDEAERQLQLLQAHGFDTALVNDSGYQVKVQLWPEWAKLAERYQLRLFPIHSFAGTDEIRVFQGKFSPYVDRHGRVLAKTPCPLDRSYWDLSIRRRLTQLAQISLTTRVDGLLFDTEMYGGNISIYREPCFCDHCWGKFMRDTSSSLPLKTTKEQRFALLNQQNLLLSYALFQEQQVQRILSSIEQHLHRINPHLLLGFLAYRDTWFYRGLIQGLGTPASPVLVFSETSYIRGYTPFVSQEHATIVGSASPVIARHIAGLWLGRFFPEDLPSQAYTLATQTDGYWLFTVHSLWTDSPLSGPYTLHDEPAAYWATLNTANAELQRFSQAPETYQSALRPIHLSSFYDAARKQLVTPPSLSRFFTEPQITRLLEATVALHQTMSDLMYRGTTLFHGLARPGATLRITHVPLGDYSDPTSYQLFDETGSVFRQGELDAQHRTVDFRMPLDLTGRISLMTSSGANLTQVTFSGMPVVVEASSTFPLATFETRYTAKVLSPPGAKRLKLRAYCSSSEESAMLIVQSPDGKIEESAEIVEYTEVNIPLPPQTEALRGWNILVTPALSKPLEDVQLSLYDEEFPYLIISDEYPPIHRFTQKGTYGEQYH
ncbi:hypothetical protein GF339_09015 [candidate division KSB3 bacterium]|uniref:Uncharacterized protein n=1 Tax=candidate division KSB3 bacterium TaxID=2044937 RepID=A0A9D5JVK1_9BACT|nr:hypothetical protein [candidate division KSB3 bacterium]MBD3324712.1 hypothetical protein [candidate division KSB3 bacterium]